MERNIEGEWNDFTIRIVQLTDVPNILKFLAEPDNDPLRDLAPVDETYTEHLSARVAKFATLLQSEEVRELSLIAIDKKTGEIAGLHMQFIWSKEEAFRASIKTEKAIPTHRRILDLIHASLKETELCMFARYGVEFVVWNCMVAVDCRHRNIGLASEMYSRVTRLLRSKKFQLAFSVFTSPYSRRAAQKEGFVELDRVYFSELRNENGEQILPNDTRDGFASVMVLQL